MFCLLYCIFYSISYPYEFSNYIPHEILYSNTYYPYENALKFSCYFLLKTPLIVNEVFSVFLQFSVWFPIILFVICVFLRFPPNFFLYFLYAIPCALLYSTIFDSLHHSIYNFFHTPHPFSIPILLFNSPTFLITFLILHASILLFLLFNAISSRP